jgi:subtilisin family serine protease
MIVNNYFRPMSLKPFGLLLTALFASVPAAVFGQPNPRQGPEINAAEILASSTLDLPDPAEDAEFEKAFSQPFLLNDGSRKTYLLCADELYQTTSDGSGQILKVTGATSASTLAQVANILRLEHRLETRLVAYSSSGTKNPANRKTLAREVVLKTSDREAAIRAAEAAGLRLQSEPSYAPDTMIFTSDNPTTSLLAVFRLQAYGYPHARILVYHRASPLFLPDDPLFPNQWHIRGRGQNGAKKASDARITPVWEQRSSSGSLIRGTGVTIGIVDDGVQMDHPDLTNNISTVYFHNWGSGSTNDPSPGYSSDNHGTAVAGVAAAVGFNGIGVTGAAPGATIVPMRFTSDEWTDAQEADMYAYGNGAVRIKNNSWGLGNYSTALTSLGNGSDYSSTTGWGAQSESPADSLTGSALATAASQGQIILFAAGNGRKNQEDVNFRARQNSIYSIAVGAVNDQAILTDYSTPGASVLISAPSGLDRTPNRLQATSTTDRTGPDGDNAAGFNSSQNLPDYTDDSYTKNFNGTSSATPVVSGVTALVLQANPSLNWRDVKEIYIRSATRNDSGDSDWARNGAGFWFNHKYGAGLINASEAVRLAKNWSNLGSMTSVSIPLSSLPANIRDNNAGGLVKYFDTRSISGLRVEHATVTTDISHPSRGELQIQLTSPAGTTSRLAEKHTSYAPDPADYPDWTFSTVHNWGEDSRGLWKLKIADRVPGNTGTLNSATLTLYGTAK